MFLSFEGKDLTTNYKQYFFPTAEIKDYNVKIDGHNDFNQPVKSNLKIYDNIRKIATSQGDDYTTGCLLDYSYLN